MKVIIVTILLSGLTGFAQQPVGRNTCQGAIKIIEGQELNISFPGAKGVEKTNICSYVEKPTLSKNNVWFLFEPVRSGKLDLSCRIYLDTFDLVVVRTNINASCKEIEETKAVPVFIKPNTNCRELENAQIDVEKGYSYTIVYFSKDKDESNISLQVDFQAINMKGDEVLDTLRLNLVYDKSKPIYSIHVLDQETKKPISSRIVISSSSDLDGTYLASDLFMNITRSVKNGVIKVDAEGYLSKDFENHYFKTDGKTNTKDSIYLKKIKRGTVAKLDKIYFQAGSEVILDESLPKLRRLRDFMVLNPTVTIEIQGHVNLDGSKRSSTKLSTRRAKQILKYLVREGISKHRLTAVGFGFDKPVYKQPVDDDQKEANRRVEILIK